MEDSLKSTVETLYIRTAIPFESAAYWYRYHMFSSPHDCEAIVMRTGKCLLLYCGALSQPPYTAITTGAYYRHSDIWNGWNDGGFINEFVTCGDRINSVKHSEYHCCWCPGSLCHQDISIHDIEYNHNDIIIVFIAGFHSMYKDMYINVDPI